MYKISLKTLLIATIIYPLNTMAKPAYISADEAVKLALEPQFKIHNLTKNSTKAELVGLNKYFNRIDAVRRQFLGQESPSVSANILNADDTPEAIELKINTIMGNNAKPEDFMHLMEPINIDDEEPKTQTSTEEQTTLEAQTAEINPPTSTTTKEVIVEEEDDSTKHIYRRKVFTKQ